MFSTGSSGYLCAYCRLLAVAKASINTAAAPAAAAAAAASVKGSCIGSPVLSNDTLVEWHREPV